MKWSGAPPRTDSAAKTAVRRAVARQAAESGNAREAGLLDEIRAALEGLVIDTEANRAGQGKLADLDNEHGGGE
jgi:hypothetical protein